MPDERIHSAAVNAAAVTSGASAGAQRRAASDATSAANANASASPSAGPRSIMKASGPTNAAAVSPNHENESVKKTRPLR